MMYKTYRIYGNVLETWKHEQENGRVRTCQVEIAYKEYDAAGELVGVGSEDFSIDRYHKELREAYVWAWDGERRNKGGFRWFDFEGRTIYRRKDVKLVKEHYKRVYNAAVVELRN